MSQTDPEETYMSTQRRMVVLAGIAALGLSGLAAPALAHHSFAMFDQQQEKTLSGVVEKFEWTNPHTFIWLDVANGQAVEQWGIEGMSPNFLERRGWTKNTLAPGDKVTVIFHPLRDGSKGGSFVKVVLANGKEMNMLGQS
jgi:hypothetical protein